ncbi:MAG: heavy metal translocating P-type ATPase [Eubacteriales bacterium]|nr:heavy metal translocating P-type ATPase [Eubacteriales bacterium]
MEQEQKIKLARIIATVVLLILLNALGTTGIVRLIGFLIAYLVIGYDVLLEAFEGVKEGEMLDECFLMVIATLGAFGLAIYEKSGDFNEAIFVMLFFQLGEFFEDFAVDRSRDNISKLMDIRPDYANLLSGEKVSPDTVEVGSIIVVNPGEKVPIDGIVTEGNSVLDTSALTGESKPRSVKEGDEIVSGCINKTGLIKVRTTKEFGQSTVSRILELVEESSERKSKSEDFISKYAKIYTPVVCILALCLCIIPPVVRLVLGTDPVWNVWIYRALTFLVISCPCALVMSIPLTFFAGLGGASREGILIKGSNYLETLSKVKTAVFDKTGTLTKGEFSVTEIKAEGVDEKTLLEYAAYAENASSHPIAESIRRAYGKDIDASRLIGVEEESGGGIKAVISTADGEKKVACGNAKLMKSLGITPADSVSGTVVFVAIDEKYAGYILISDEVKETSAEAVKKLEKIGVGRIVMLTGDDETSAKGVAEKLGIREYYAGLLPQDKVSKIEELLSDKTAFVGDGINDAPVLMRADVGVAMGALGSDAAIEAADVVIMDDDPLKLAKGIEISRKCLGIVYQNIIFAFAVKGICLILSALGFANMWLAVFADVGVMVIAVLNAIRAGNTSIYSLIKLRYNTLLSGF